jgi:endonuclease G
MIDLEKLDATLSRIQQQDPALGQELQAQLAQHAIAKSLTADPMLEFTAKSIVLRAGRPVLAVLHDAARLIFKDAESAVWRERLKQSRKQLVKAIPAVGRIELKGHPNFDWVGTGWLVAPDIIVTNRHVAREFARAGHADWVFRAGVDGQPMQANIDFLEEFQHAADRAFSVVKILHIEDDDGPDLALLQIKGKNSAQPIALSDAPVQPDQYVAVIGYPARDSRIPDLPLMEKIFGSVYDKKRLAPGQASNSPDALLHDCTTLGGCSGSPVIDLATGKALGLHFAGRFMETNYAVPAAVLAEQLHAVMQGSSRHSGVQLQTPAPRITQTIPLLLTLEIAPASADLPLQVISASVKIAPRPKGSGEGEDDATFATEGRPEDYAGRMGYQTGFLGNGMRVPLPAVKRDKAHVLTFASAGNPRATELKYEHFSVVMHRERRLCIFSAVNIDGATSKRSQRAGWRLDPRIPETAQIKGECYGNPPRFSRGHMTRREDPVWGMDEEAARANADSMHVTNTVPQMQTFNAPIWLGLEDYALENARKDRMKLCVITGPILKSDDPVLFGIQIPRAFWKVIAFVHDGTGKLSVTGYSISQEKYLRPEEFVFGAYETHQRALHWIEQEAGVSFGALKKADRFKAPESVDAGALQRFEQIQFV